MAKELSRLKPQDYDILYSGKHNISGKDTPVDAPEFGKAQGDYIEMVVSTTTGVFLDSFVIARGDECQNYKNDDNTFKINPGIFLREKGYFSGEYNIEFNFLREIAGSEKGVLVDRKNEIYNGDYFVNTNGLIYKGNEGDDEVDENLLREFDYKFYIDEISADRTEVRLGTLPIKSQLYNTEFKGLGSDETILTYPNELQDVGTKIFQINNLGANTLPENIVGGDLIIRDAYTLPSSYGGGGSGGGGGVGGTVVVGQNDFYALVGVISTKPRRIGRAGLMTYGSALKYDEVTRNIIDTGGNGSETEKTSIFGGDNNYYRNIKNINYNAMQPRQDADGYDQSTILKLVDAGNDTARKSLQKLLFHDIGYGDRSGPNTGEIKDPEQATKYFIEQKRQNPQGAFYGGAALIGYTTYEPYGFPLWLKCNNEKLLNFVSTDQIKSYFEITIYGTQITENKAGQRGDYGRHKYSQKYSFTGENTFIRLPRHPEFTLRNSGDIRNLQGALFHLDIDFVIEFPDKDPQRNTITKRNTFVVFPDNDYNRFQQTVERGWGEFVGNVPDVFGDNN